MKTKPTKETESNMNAPAEERNPGDFRPTPTELANLAAVLADGQQITRESAMSLANQARTLWAACKQSWDQETSLAKKNRAAEAESKAIQALIPMPKSFPASFGDFLRLVIGGKTETDRMETFRTYLREHIRQCKLSESSNPNLKLEDIPEPTLDEVNAAIAKERERAPFIRAGWEARATLFLRWKKAAKQRNLTERASKGAAAKIAKAVAKKAAGKRKIKKTV